MATIPNISKLTANSAEILNTIRSNASPMYRSTIPVVDYNNLDTLRAVGSILMDYPGLKNEFISTLVNRIGRVILTSKMYSNPWAVFKKGMLEFGETVEEIFTNIANPNNFDPETAETNVFKRAIPDVRTAFHVMNYQKFYKATVSNDQLRQAFLSWEGTTNLISGIVDSLYTGANYDEFIVMKYLIARLALDGDIPSTSLGSAATPQQNVTTIKGVSNQFEFLSGDYNISGVKNNTLKNEQYLILNADFAAQVDVEVLAVAFNMSKAEFMGHVITVDNFAKLDNERLALLFGDDPNYVPIEGDSVTALQTIKAVLVSKDWFMVFDNFQNFTEQYNGEGLYWNYWYHTWKTFSASPFANAMLFTSEDIAVNGITVTPATATVVKGGTQQFKAAVDVSGFAPQGVAWSVSGSSAVSSGTSVNQYGLLTVGADEGNTSLTVKATSVYNGSVSDDATVTLTT